MTDKESGKIIQGHEYDGIQELDNPLPNWWVILFWLCIIFSGAYVAYYQLGPGPSIEAEFQNDTKNLKEKQAAGKGDDSGLEKTLQAAIADPASPGRGKAVYLSRCAPCHASEGQGLIGPNLTDDSWISGKGTALDIAVLIRDGVAAKGMPPWGAILKSEELVDVTSFVMSLKGSHPANGKAPEGTKVN